MTSEFVGLARAMREKDLPDVKHIHFNGASGNVAAGKYNDGSPEARVELTKRMHAGMKAAWETTEKFPITASDVEWRTELVTLPLGDHLKEDDLTKILDDPQTTSVNRLTAAKHLAWLKRTEAGHQDSAFLPAARQRLHSADAGRVVRRVPTGRPEDEAGRDRLHGGLR